MANEIAVKEEAAAEALGTVQQAEAKPLKRKRTKKASSGSPTIKEEDPPAKKPRRKIKSDSPPILDSPDLHAYDDNAHWVGAHMSIADGVENSISSARRYACQGFALFLKAKMSWTYKPLAQENIEKFRRWLPALGYSGARCLPHGSYLINLGNPNPAKNAQAMESFLDDLRRCALLGIGLYNFHPGSGVGDSTKEEACAQIARCINDAHATLAREGLTCPVILLENMAGQGQQVGRHFEELAAIIAGVSDKSLVGVCLDTAHAFAAGFDIRTTRGFDAMMGDFDRIVGAQYLRGMHLNDSKEALGSRKDRHENIAQGHIGLAPFWSIMNSKRFEGMPLVLETPAASWRVWKGEIEALYALQGLPHDEAAWVGVKEKLAQLQKLPKEMEGTDLRAASKAAERAAMGLPPREVKPKVKKEKEKAEAKAKKEKQGDKQVKEEQSDKSVKEEQSDEPATKKRRRKPAAKKSAKAKPDELVPKKEADAEEDHLGNAASPKVRSKRRPRATG